MLVVPSKKAVVLKVRDPARITTLIPSAKTFKHKGQTLTAVPHRLDEVKVLRNLGFDVPSPIRYNYEWSGEYTPFHAQAETAEFLTLHNRSFCLNDLGCGKTLATLWAFDYLKQEGFAQRALVVSPLSTLERAWGDEIFRHFPHLDFAVLHGSADKRRKLLAQSSDIYIINHDGIKVTGIVDALKRRPDIDTIIIDEIAQIGRSAGTDRWKALSSIVNKQHPRRVWGLTGTPIPNAPTDAWAQCRLVVPEKVPPYFNRFRDMVMYQKGPFLWLPRPNAVEVVNQCMQPAIRFSRDQCVDLPECIYETRSVEMTPEQKKAYKEMFVSLATEVSGGEVVAFNEAIKVSKLVQIACGVAYDKQREDVLIPSQTRLQETLDIIHEAGSKVIVFVPYVGALQHLSAFLTKRNVTNAVIHGGVGKTERDKIFDEFQKTDTPKVLVAQPAAMSHGLTLTAASTIVWFAPVFSNETFQQANGRITRPGQKHTQFIIMIEGSDIERRIYTKLKAKEKMQGLLLEMVRAA